MQQSSWLASDPSACCFLHLTVVCLPLQEANEEQKVVTRAAAMKSKSGTTLFVRVFVCFLIAPRETHVKTVRC